MDPMMAVVPDRSPYEFVFNNPVSLTDPSGLFPGFGKGKKGGGDVAVRTPRYRHEDSGGSGAGASSGPSAVGGMLRSVGDFVVSAAKFVSKNPDVLTTASNTLNELSKGNTLPNDLPKTSRSRGYGLSYGGGEGYKKENTNGIIVPYILGGMETTMEALAHYYLGGGRPVRLGINTVKALIFSEGFQRRHLRIISGQTSALKGFFSVDLTGSVFHVGRTNVDYSINCTQERCIVVYDMFVRDGFWDPDYIDEYAGELLKKMGLSIPILEPDGTGANLERGGMPFEYKPIRGVYTFPNPGY